MCASVQRCLLARNVGRHCAGPRAAGSASGAAASPPRLTIVSSSPSTVVRIAHLVPPGVHAYSGLLTALVHLAAAQARRGHRVELWQPGPWPGDASDLDVELMDAGVTRVAFTRRGGSAWLDGDALRATAAREADLVHLHGVFNPFNNRIAARLRVPYVVSPHGGYALESLAYHAIRKRVFSRLFERPMLRGARMVCALTSAEASELRRYGYTGSVAVVPNGVTMAQAVPTGEALRLELGWPRDGRVALYVGRLDVRAKRLDALVSAIARSPGWRLALVGGEFRNGVRTLLELATRVGVSDRVRVVPPKRGHDLHATLTSADLFVLVSRSEGLPMALLEAAVRGVPSLVSPEVERATGIVAAGGGWCAPIESLGETLTALTTLDPEEWRRKASAAASYGARHDWAAIAVTYEKVYEAALSADGSR